MEQRLNVFEKGKEALKPLFLMGSYLKKSTMETTIHALILVRVSQINGCAYCLDMHYKEARAKGETEQRLYGLSSWRETPYYSDRERAALTWAESVTGCDVPNDVYEEVKNQFADEELVDLTIAIVGINSWNRINLAFPMTPRTYQIGQFG